LFQTNYGDNLLEIPDVDVTPTTILNKNIFFSKTFHILIIITSNDLIIKKLS